jgi:HEAT repeat protein
VSGICANLHRAYRDLRFYPQHHPTARESLDRLVQMLSAHLEAQGSLSLDVEESRLLYEGEQVYRQEATRDNLAFLMFRDGIRSLSFHPGVEAREVEFFVDCLAHADDLAEVEHDLATALWEHDFTHIDYRVADQFLGGEVLREGTIDALRETVFRRLSEAPVAAVSVAGVAAGDLLVVEPMQVDERGLALTAAEIELCERLADDPSDALDDFAVVLLEIVGGLSEEITEDDALIRSLAMVIGSYLENRNLDGLDLVLDRLTQLETQGRCPPGLVSLVVDAGATKERLARMLGGIGQAPAEEVARIEGLLTGERRWIYPALLEVMAETDDRSIRKSLLAVLGSEEGVPLRHLVPMLRDPRWYVVRNAVQLAARSHDPELPGHLERLVRHADVRVRREVMRTLDTVGAPALHVLAKALDDEDSSVRILVARSLGRHGGQEHAAMVLARVEGRNFDTRPAEEVEAFLVALAVLAKERAVPVLDGLWRRRIFRARPASLRLAALQALGAIDAPAAQSVLMEAAKSGDAQARQTANRALHEAQVRRSGSLS